MTQPALSEDDITYAAFPADVAAKGLAQCEPRACYSLNMNQQRDQGLLHQLISESQRRGETVSVIVVCE